MASFSAFLVVSALLVAGSACQPRPRQPAAPAAGCLDPGRANPRGSCPMDYDPVCGCNGHTYSNACVARNAGLHSFRPGPCPTRP